MTKTSSDRACEARPWRVTGLPRPELRVVRLSPSEGCSSHGGDVAHGGGSRGEPGSVLVEDDWLVEICDLGAGVVVALLFLDFFQGVTYAIVVSAGMLLATLVLRLSRRMPVLLWRRPASRDLIAVVVLYVAVVAAARVAFVWFDHQIPRRTPAPST